MTQLTRKRTLLAKIESSYGVDPTPTGAANAIVLSNLVVSPLVAQQVSRNVIRGFLANFEQLNANTHIELSFNVEIAGAGTAGSAPAYGPLLRACGLSETLNAAPVSGTAQAGGANTITLAAGASSVDNVYVGLPISITAGTGSGQTGSIVAYNGTTKVATVMNNWTTNPSSSSTYSIAAGAVYSPISGSFESCTMYFNSDGVNQKVTGCRGTVEIDITAQAIPVYKFKFTGLYNAPTDTALPSCIYTQQVPVIANNANTTPFSLYGSLAFILQSLSLNINTSVNFIPLIGIETVEITDRTPSGQVVIEAPAIATKDFFTASQQGTTGSFSITHGTVAGNKVKVDCASIDLGNPSYNDNNGINMLQLPFQPLPTIGNDDFRITVF